MSEEDRPVLDAAMAELHTAIEAAEPAEGQPAPVAEPQVPIRRVVSVDEDVLPDTEEWAPSLRGQPIRALVEDRLKAVKQRDDIGNRANALEAEKRVLEKALEIVTRQRDPVTPPAPTPAPESGADMIRRRGIDVSDLFSDGDKVLGATIEAAEERVAPKLREEFRAETETLRAKVDALESERRTDRLSAMYRDVGAHLKFDPQTWLEDADVISAYVLKQNLPTDDPQSYVEAGEWWKKKLGSSPSAPAVPPTPTPAPPVGNGPAAPVAAAAVTPRATGHDRAAIDSLARVFSLGPEVMDRIETEIATEQRPRRRSA